VLRDPLRIVVPDAAHSTLEERYRVIGMATAGRLLVVIVAIDGGDTIRLISARRPTRRERHAYENSP
jgi:uncharacterized DUF497 family protein